MAINAKDYPIKVKTNLWADTKHTIFFYNFKQDDKRYRGLIDLSDKSAWGKRDRVNYAEAELSKIKLERKAGVLNSSIRLDDWFNTVYDRLDKTDWNKRLKSHYIRYISPYIGKKQVKELLQSDIRDVLKKQRDAGLAPRTAKQTKEALKPVFDEAIANKLILSSPMEGIKIKLPKTKKIVTNASDRLLEIYDVIMAEFVDEPFYKSFYLFALQGRRKSETLNLKWEHIDFIHDLYVLVDTKNGEEQKHFLPADIKALLLEFKMDTEYVYHSRITGSRLVNIRKTTARLKKRLGDSFSLHYLRNVIVSAMAEQGLAATHMSGALGHRSAGTIDKYLTLNYHKGSRLASEVIGGITKKRD